MTMKKLKAIKKDPHPAQVEPKVLSPEAQMQGLKLMIGERQYLIRKLNAEIESAVRQIDQLVLQLQPPAETSES
jgi:hypothetical protein